MKKIFERNPNTGQIRSRNTSDYGNETIIKEGVDKKIPNWLKTMVKEEPNDMELGKAVRTKIILENKIFQPKGKLAPDGDYWFSKEDRKQRG
jgi:hypothetical protein|tara:strand:- start:3162 stop:3437 length:276 start_codon:yes stop_codon:yes gene_type:complete